MGELIKILDLVDDKWTVSTDQIPDGDEDQAEKPLAIITSIGQYGIGKSFLQNILLGAIQKGESFFEDETELLEVFALETSMNSETRGIDMFNKYLKKPFNNQDMALSLWDAEGPSNPNQSHDQDLTVFALSAVFSQVLIYNVKEKFTAQNMDQIQVFMEKMREQLSGEMLKFQTLIIVFRDADDEFGYNWDGGQAYMKYMKREGGGQGQTATFFREIEDTFSSVLFFMMPLPNREVRTKRIKVSHMRGISDVPFRDSLQIFTNKLLNEIVQPGMVVGEAFHVCDLKPKLTTIAKLFQSELTQTNCTTLANFIKGTFLRKEADKYFQEYQNELLKEWGTYQLENTRKQRHDKLKKKTLEKIKAAIKSHYVEEWYSDGAITNLDQLIDERFKSYNDHSSANQKKIWKISEVIIDVGAVGLIVYFSPATAIAAATGFTLGCFAGYVISKGWDIVKKFSNPKPTVIVINVSVVIFVSQVKVPQTVSGACLALQ